MNKKQAPPFFQPKLTIGQPNDKYEKEADAVADAVVNQTTAQPVLQAKNISMIQCYMTNAEFDERGTNTERIEEDKRIQEKPEVQQKPIFESNEESSAGNVQRKCATCENEEMVQKMDEEEMINEKEDSIQRKCTTCEQEENTIQSKSVGGGEMTASSGLQNRLNSTKGGGSALPDDTRTSMESAIGADFSGVRIHTDSSAVQMNKELGAQAFTHGSDVYFNSGKYDTSGKEGRRLLGHELTHVVQQGQANSIQGKPKKPSSYLFHTIIQRQPPVIQRRAMTQAEKNLAKVDARNKFSPMSRRIIQNIIGLVGRNIDGIIGDQTIQTISDNQTAQGIPDNGIIDVASLDALVAARNTNQTQRHEAIRLVADYYNIDLTAETLTAYASRTAASSTRFETGLRVIEIGTGFFASSTMLRDEIIAQLATANPNPIFGPVPWAPTILNPQQVRSAISYNNNKFNDIRSISTFQNHLGMMYTGIVDEDFVQRVANVQDATAALTDTDGKIGPQTFRHFFVELRNSGNHNAVINLIIDFFNMPDYGMVTALYFEDDSAFTSNAATSKNVFGPTRIRVRKGLYQSFEGAVHTIRHELEHVRQNFQDGISNDPLMEFLGEANEIMSVGMPHETLFNQNHDITNAAGTRFLTTDGLRDDAGRLWTNWTNMTVADQRSYWFRFVQIRSRLRKRVAGTYLPTATQDTADWAAASIADRASWTALLANFNGQVRP